MLGNNVIIVAYLDTIQLYVSNQGLVNNTIALADLLQEDPVTDIAADQSTRGNSWSPSRGRPYRSPSRSPHCKQYRSPQRYSRNRRSPTTHIHQVSHITHILPRPHTAEGQLITDRASNGHTSFHTMLQVDTKQGAKSISVKVDPVAELNTITLSHYRKLFKKNFTKAGDIKKSVLHPTSHLWSSHDSKPQQFQ